MNQIYVGNIPYSKSETDVKELFGQFGDVLSVKFINDHESGRFRGFGFVEMDSKEAVQEAISKLEGNEFDGRALRVNEARPKERRAPRT